MKRILFYLLCFCIGLFFGGCSAPKKLTGSKQETAKVSEQTAETTTGKNSLFIDTTKTARGEVVYTKIEFYPPEPTTEPGQVNNEATPVASTPNKHPPNTGAIKSIETLTIKKETEEKGVTENQSSAETSKATNIEGETAKKEETAAEPAKDPYRYRYIFGILVIVIAAGTAVYFWLRKTKAVTSIVSFFKRIF